MSAEQNKELAREAIRIWSTGDFDVADEVYALDYVNHQHHDPNDPRDLHGDRQARLVLRPGLVAQGDRRSASPEILMERPR